MIAEIIDVGAEQHRLEAELCRVRLRSAVTAKRSDKGYGPKSQTTSSARNSSRNVRTDPLTAPSTERRSFTEE